MGWKSWLAGAGLIAAAPFTGGTSLGAALPLLLGSAGANVIGAGLASDTSKKAATTQVNASKDALALQQPYLTMGANAANRLNALMGGAGALSRLGGSPQGGMVTVRAPDGSTRSVTPQQAQFLTQRGGQVVNG